MIMYVFSIEGVSLTASFRSPETHTFHKTLPLPPKTTIIGMMGAALGLSLEEVHKLVEDQGFLVGVYGFNKGLMRDLWNYRKLTGKEKKYTEDDIKNRRQYSILIREYLFENQFVFYFGSDEVEKLEHLRSAFLSPTYPLTVGNSDDLFKTCKIGDIIEEKKCKLSKFEYTVLPGDLSQLYKNDIDFSQIPIVQTINTPQVILLPTKFIFEGDERRVSERQKFTFISTPVKLKTEIDGYTVNGKNVVLL
ncbi:MAG: CRISPR-associated protein Cas5 [Methanomethylovorans sp.]|uniref:CRISPR-associated protein Cas5 n=2 Tax=Methanomethylovorans sp. TaxID=2758717 RepID=UPI000ACE3873|nr:CRISPR-associated protein Cas5 [Methanomethylovorans sp.]